MKRIPVKIRNAALIGAAAAFPIFLAAPGRTTKRQRAPFHGWNFAHRGLHSEDRSVPENSLAAFRLAGSAGYGAELDVQLSRDGQVVVFHDDTLDRVCGVHARVEDLTYDELRQLRLCGTEEYIPLLAEALEVFGGRGPLIVELKNGSRNRELCEKTHAILAGYKGVFCIESFNPMIVCWFRRNAKEILRGQLATDRKDYGGSVSTPMAFLLSRCLLNFLSRPQFIAYRVGSRPAIVHLSEALGAMRFGWTSHSEASERGRDGVIFEFYRPQKLFK